MKFGTQMHDHCAASKVCMATPEIFLVSIGRDSSELLGVGVMPHVLLRCMTSKRFSRLIEVKITMGCQWRLMLSLQSMTVLLKWCALEDV